MDSNSLEKILKIASTTWRESVRSKVLYTLFFFAVALVLLTTLFGAVTVGDQVKVIEDFGLFACSFFTVAYAVIAGAALLHKELQRKTVYNILAKPVRRAEFVIGKYLGMLGTVALMLALLGPALVAYVFLFKGRMDWLILEAVFGILLQLVIVAAVAIFFSAIVVTPLLSGAFTLAVFLAGRSTEYVLYFVKDGSVKGIAAKILEWIYFLLPHLDTMDLANQAVYGVGAPFAQLCWSTLYAVGYAGILLVSAIIIFERRQFDA